MASAPAPAPAPAPQVEPQVEIALGLGQSVTVTLPGPSGDFAVIMPGAGYALKVDSASPVFFAREEGRAPIEIRRREDLRVKGVVQRISGAPGQAVSLLAIPRGDKTRIERAD